MAAPKTVKTPKTPNKAVSCTMPENVFKALDEYRWTVRQNLSEMITTCVKAYLDANGVSYEVEKPAAE